ncbi:MAG: PAS domain-containing protein [Methyloceanibacter sp.]|uniref:PAS domain-containing protein n=1 Tax=Methyloceanibacter sp. TaxID=1965321 RepID=UPI003D9BD73D
MRECNAAIAWHRPPARSLLYLLHQQRGRSPLSQSEIFTLPWPNIGRPRNQGVASEPGGQCSSQRVKQLYAYWDRVRNGRPAPRRFEIEPAKIAPLLPETFIAQCSSLSGYRFRLVGTRICEHFGRAARTF